MADTWTNQNTVTIAKASQITEVKAEIIQHHIESGTIESQDGKIQKSVCDMILEHKSLYIGIKDFLKQHDSGRFESKLVKNRNRYIDFLEENNYFGIEIHEPTEILFNLPEREEFYITKEDALFFDYNSIRFFQEFGLTEEEKAWWIINHSKEHPTTVEYINRYLTYIEDEDNIYTPSLTDFVRTIFDMPDIKQLTDDDIISAIEEAETVRTKELLTDFFKFVARYENVKYHNIDLKKKESDAEPAYPYEDFVKLAKILFNTDYDKEHNLTLKALCICQVKMGHFFN